MLSFLKKSKGILGMNSRNLDFIRPGGSKKNKKLVDDKLKTKVFLRKAGLPVAKLISVVNNWKEFDTFDWASLPKSFVLKPNKGLGGEGIMVTFGRKKNDKWVLPLDKEASTKDLMLRVANILDGDYSINSVPDVAFFEERLKIHPAFKLYSYKGIPDIRIIIYNKVPIMAMLRLPTKESNGKANLHVGGVGVGIDIETGITTHAVHNGKTIEYVPGSRFALRGIRIPNWQQILEIAIEAQKVSKLNYVGVDIAIDREKGPIILELNARPGLEIQLANLRPLKERLLRVKGLKIKTTQKGVSVAKELFGGELEQEIEELSGRQVIGIIETVKVSGKNKRQIELKAKIDTGAGISSIDEDLAIALGYESAINYYKSFNIKSIMSKDEVDALSKSEVWKEIVKHPDIIEVAKIFNSHGASYRMEVSLKIKISGVNTNATVTVVSRKNMKYPLLIGRRDLKSFLVDPSKKIK
jgi:alpha-L-glutamate ligase-like protein